MKEIVVYLSLIVCIVGGILFLILKNPGQADWKALAKDMFWVGLLAFLFSK